MEKERAINLFKRQLERIEQVRSMERLGPAYRKWKRDTEVLIENAFGSDTRHIKDFKKISFVYPYENEREEALRYKEGFNQAQSIINSYIDEIIEFWDDIPIYGYDAITVISKICSRFHLFARQLQRRQRNRDPIEVNDEYDLQDLFHAILHLHFDDIRPEEWTPSYAGGSSRMDFLIKDERLVIELKKSRGTLRSKEVGEELMVDIQRYGASQDCSTLICFVYDPDSIINNPRGLENDLSKTYDDLLVKVIIAPR